MKILVTNHGLNLRGGTELFTAELAEGLSAIGCEVAVYATTQGEISRALEKSGIPVVSHPSRCPFTPDLIHGQHHLQAMTALCAWPETPGVFMMHGMAPWEEHPPGHPRLRRYLAPSSHFGWWLEQETDVLKDRLVVVPNWFDPERFTRVRSPDDGNGKALVFHNSIGKDSRAWRALSDACEIQGLSLQGLGREFGETEAEPETLLADFEVVFAAGRSAIEALASGCTVIPVSADRIAARAHPGILDALIDLNFSPDPSHYQIHADLVVDELNCIRPDESVAVTERIRRDLTRDAAVARLISVYREVLDESKEENDFPAELGALSQYLGGIAEQVKGVDEGRAALVEQKGRASARADRWKGRADHAEAQLSWLADEMESGPWWRGRLWRRLRRAWENRRNEDTAE